MNQLQLVAIAHALPRDATGITIEDRETNEAIFTAKEPDAWCSGYSDSPARFVKLVFSPLYGGKDRWCVRAIVEPHHGGLVS